MANYVENFKNKLDWAMPFQRTGKFPLDRTDLFSSYEDAVKYAKGDATDPDSRGLCGASYVGQIITVYENDKVTVYKINADRTIKEVGTAVVTDDKSLDNLNGVLSLKGFAEVIAAGNYAGKQPRINANGEIEWYAPDTNTVSGLQETVGALKDTVDGTEDTPGLVKRVTDLENNKVDKEEGKGLSSNDYTTEEKNKLEGIAEGAQANVIESISVNGQKVEPTSKSVDITVPVKVSDLTNDSNFIDNTVNNLTNYYLKTETYTKEEVTQLLGQISTMDVLKVDALPTENISSKTIYLVAKDDAGDEDIYTEYLYTATGWEIIGSTKIDLSNYLQKNGDASGVTVTFVAPESRELPVSGEALNIILGKILKYLADLKDVAFTGSYNDLKDTPVNVVYATTGTLVAGNTSVDIAIPEGSVFVGASITDNSTGETVFTDVSCVNNVVTISVAAALTSALDIVVSYRV